jgi:hypothetical protein
MVGIVHQSCPWHYKLVLRTATAKPTQQRADGLKVLGILGAMLPFSLF